jgi:hypothetical protein
MYISITLIHVVTWPLADTMSRKLDGCYTKLLRYALNYKWSDYVPNSILYNGLEFVEYWRSNLVLLITA